MKKLIFIIIITSTLYKTDANGQVWDITEFKTCLFHDQAYSIRRNDLICPILSSQQQDSYGVHTTDTVIPRPFPEKDLVVHSPECYGEGPHPN